MAVLIVAEPAPLLAPEVASNDEIEAARDLHADPGHASASSTSVAPALPSPPVPGRELDLSLPPDAITLPDYGAQRVRPFDPNLDAGLEQRRSEQADAALLAELRRQRYGLDDDEYVHATDADTRAIKHNGRCWALRQDSRDPLAPVVWARERCRDAAARRHWSERDRVPDRFLR